MKIKLRDGNHLNAILSQTVNLPIVQDDEGNYCVFSTDKDNNGCYRKSGFYFDKENAIKHIGRNEGEKKESIDTRIKNQVKNQDWHIIDWVIRYPEKMTHCRLMPNAKEICEKFGYFWNEEMEKMLKEEVLEVAEETNKVLVWQKDKTDDWIFPLQAIIPVIVGEEPIEEMTLEEICKALGKNIKIKK